MPIYEYKCKECNKEFEAIQKFSDDPLTECPQCKGPVEKQISQSAFHLKGGGWYSDGYGKTGGSGDKKAGSGEKSSAGENPGAKSTGGCGHSGGCSSC